jgi:hypothetical protein
LPGGDIAETDARRFTVIVIFIHFAVVLLIITVEIVLAVAFVGNIGIDRPFLVDFAKIDFIIVLIDCAFFPHGFDISDLIAAATAATAATPPAPLRPITLRPITLARFRGRRVIV